VATLNTSPPSKSSPTPSPHPHAPKTEQQECSRLCLYTDEDPPHAVPADVPPPRIEMSLLNEEGSALDGLLHAGWRLHAIGAWWGQQNRRLNEVMCVCMYVYVCVCVYMCVCALLLNFSWGGNAMTSFAFGCSRPFFPNMITSLHSSFHTF
jgi:hypothetical protein